jgi:hypothetical protein
MIKRILRLINAAAGQYFGVELVKHRDLYPWQITATRHGNSPPAKELPKEAKEYLRPNNPRLLELKARYSNFDPKVTTGEVWQEGIIQASDLASFRRDNPYVWQVRGRKQNLNDLSYALTYYALKASDSTRDVLASLDEDGLFGVHLFQADGRNISRDLLDSVREIEFIRKHVDIDAPDTNILDIGAGYGRLVYRLCQTSPTGVRVFGTDAIAESTFLSEFYLRFRSADRATVIPLDEIDAFFASTSVKLATNIHSFSECATDAIEWWVQRLSAAGVPNLLVIPNQEDPKTKRCLTSAGLDMELVFERHGYRVKVREPRFSDPLLQSYGVDPTFISLFEHR